MALMPLDGILCHVYASITITIPNHPPNPTDVWIAGILNEYHHEFGQWR